MNYFFLSGKLITRRVKPIIINTNPALFGVFDTTITNPINIGAMDAYL
jgi:hypothetical protein